MTVDTAALYVEHRTLLSSIAYRMLGTRSDAEDIVQDVFAELETKDLDLIVNVRAYLIKMVTNRCINVLKSARKTREVYIGPWLPEPEVAEADGTPEAAAMRAESISYALLVLLERLSPLERAVFILRETLDYDYRDIAELLGKSDANCRKLYGRAKLKVNSGQPQESVENSAFKREAPIALPVGDGSIGTLHVKQAEELARSFIAAAHTGNFKEFVGKLAEEARLYMDGGGKVRAAVFPIIGSGRILAFLEGIAEKSLGSTHRMLVDVNGMPGVLLKKNGEPFGTLSFQFGSHSRPVRVFMVVNPDKLRHIDLSEVHGGQ